MSARQRMPARPYRDGDLPAITQRLGIHQAAIIAGTVVLLGEDWVGVDSRERRPRLRDPLEDASAAVTADELLRFCAAKLMGAEGEHQLLGGDASLLLRSDLGSVLTVLQASVESDPEYAARVIRHGRRRHLLTLLMAEGLLAAQRLAVATVADLRDEIGPFSSALYWTTGTDDFERTFNGFVRSFARKAR